MLYMLDTDIASYIIKGQYSQLQAKLELVLPSQICISAMTKAELFYGLKKLPKNHRLHISAKKFLEIVQTLDWNSEAAVWYADIRYQLISSGQPIGEMDMMIAAHALSVSAVLVSNNQKHHSRIDAPLMLENWIDNDKN